MYFAKADFDPQKSYRFVQLEGTKLFLGKIADENTPNEVKDALRVVVDYLSEIIERDFPFDPRG